MKHLLTNLKEKINESGVALFFRESLAHPLTIGAAFPSSKKLAQAMAAQVPTSTQGFIVELGAGTGVVTEALLERGISPERIIVIERSANLAQHLRNRFPAMRIIEGDASHLAELLDTAKDRVAVIVSSLPMRSLPKTILSAIHAQLENVLQPGGLLIQYAYFTPGKRPLQLPEHFKPVHTHFVWENLPPARLYVFQRGA